MNTGKSELDSTPAGLIVLAQRELGAFVRAVEESYGSEQATLSAADWLDQLESRTRGDWRAVTIAAAERLASRVAARHIRIPPFSNACFQNNSN